jgi:hypothetical protein
MPGYDGIVDALIGVCTLFPAYSYDLVRGIRR